MGEEVATIKSRLLSPDGQKSFDKALHFKELGNTLFRRKHKLELCKALRYYSKVSVTFQLINTTVYCPLIFHLLCLFPQALLFAPWPAKNDRAEAIKEDLASCKLSLARVSVLDSTKVASSSVHESSLLATCFGNRSAVLYELGKFEVATVYSHGARMCSLIMVIKHFSSEVREMMYLKHSRGAEVHEYY